MADIYGLDFGTTNSVAAIVHDGRVVPLLGDDDRPHPSIVCFIGGDVIVGADAKRRVGTADDHGYVDVVRSPKRLLGREDHVYLAGREMPPDEIAAQVIGHVVEHALDEGPAPIDRAVVTVPVSLRGRGRQQLRAAAKHAGVEVEQFVHEPLAALYGHLRAKPDYKRRLAELEGKLMLVVDWGGGTLDLTLCTLIEGRLVQIQNQGDDGVGGDVFDDRVVALVRERHLQEHGLDPALPELPGAHATLVERCEVAKIALSHQDRYTVFVGDFIDHPGPGRTLEVTLTTEDLLSVVGDLIEAGLANIDRLLERVQRPSHAVALCLPTGGIADMPEVRRRLRDRFDASRLQAPRRGDLIIAEGAAWIAHDRLEVVLAKSFEVLHADGDYFSIIPAGTCFPTGPEVSPYPLGMYCVDPRDGLAHLQFARAVWPGREMPGDVRTLYGALRLAVDAAAPPFRERLELEVFLDANLVATVTGWSTIADDKRHLEIHDLEFGLSVREDDGDGASRLAEAAFAEDEALKVVASRKAPRGAVRLRANVTENGRGWNHVPGEVVWRYRPNWKLTSRQRDEYDYYLPCSVCGRTPALIGLEGCSISACRAPSSEATATRRASFEALRATINEDALGASG